MKTIGFFNEVEPGKAGGKGKNLIALQRAGIPVPPGFILTYDAYTEFKETGGMPVEMKQQVLAHYREIEQETGSPQVSVRSSASAEDMQSASFAGMYDTYLYVKTGEELIERIVDCWRSLENERAAAYREQMQIPRAGIKMAVVVQAMIDPKAAGILFTAHPNPGKPRETVMIVESNWGCGETVVSGRATPDHFVIARDGQYTILEKVLGEKEVVMQAGQLKEAAEEDMPGKRAQFSLTGDELTRLSRQGEEIEAYFGRPQDIEWALANDGRIFILQSRPITVT